MQATMNDMRNEAAETAGQAARTAAEASRRAIEGMQAAAQVSRTYLEESSELGRALLTAWATGMEATWKAGFAMQDAALGVSHAVLNASIAALDTTANGSRNATQQLVAAARQTQETALRAFWLNMQTMEKVVLGATSTEKATR